MRREKKSLIPLNLDWTRCTAGNILCNAWPGEWYVKAPSLNEASVRGTRKRLEPRPRNIQLPFPAMPLGKVSFKSMKKQIGLLLLILWLSSCDKAMPTGFWRDYKNELIKEDVSDQGPWGGHRAMFWKSKTENEFRTKEIIDFAKENNWVFIEKKNVKKEELESWTYNRELVFPLNHEGMQSGSGTPSYADFPRWLNDDLELLKFKTPWIVVEPGSGESSDAYGYVLINNKGNEMSMYHMWGE